MFNKLTPLAKVLIALLIVGVLGFCYSVFKKSAYYSTIVPKSKINRPEGVSKDTPIVRIGVVTWGGYAGGQLFNEGFKANAESRFYKKYGFLVDFVVLDDFNTSRDAWKSGDIDLLWVTVDAYPTEVEGIKEFDPKFIMQADWSRGGDAVVARSGISSMEGLRGKKVAYAPGTPSHTFLICMLQAAGMTIDDIKKVEVSSAINSAETFKAQKVDAAVVWSPDDSDCVKNVPGSKILKNTKTASNIIADGFYVKGKYLSDNKKMITQLVEGWLTGNAEINSSISAKKRAVQILADGLNQPIDYCENAINNVRLATLGDNKNFFNVNGSFLGVKGEDLYSTMSFEYAKLGLAPAKVSPWREVSDSSIIRNMSLMGTIHDAESAIVKFEEKPVKGYSDGIDNSTPFATKKVIINFAVNSAELSDEARIVIDREMGNTLKFFAKNRTIVEGNTDNDGDRAFNIALSRKRAQSVVNYLVDRYGFSRSRFIVKGNGSTKPVADNNTSEGRALNRRTEFGLLP